MLGVCIKLWAGFAYISYELGACRKYGQATYIKLVGGIQKVMGRQYIYICQISCGHAKSYGQAIYSSELGACRKLWAGYIYHISWGQAESYGQANLHILGSR